MKKILIFSLALITALSLVSCNGSPAAETETTDENSSYSTLEEMKLDETVVLDNEYCRVTVTGINEVPVEGSDKNAHELLLELENKTSERELIFYAERISVNGNEWEEFYSEFVAAGETKDSEIYFGTEDFDNDIGPFTDIELEMFVYDNSENGGDTVAEGSVRLYPY